MEEKLTCHLCNAPLNLDDYDLAKAVPQLMKEKQFCFRCAFWHRILESDKTLIEDSDYEMIPLVTPYFQHYTIHLNKLWLEVATFRRESLCSTKKYIAVAIMDNIYCCDKVYIGSYNNWGFQGIIPAHLRELFTPNGIILTPEQLDDLLNRKSFTAADLKILIDNCIKSE